MSFHASIINSEKIHLGYFLLEFGNFSLAPPPQKSATNPSLLNTIMIIWQNETKHYTTLLSTDVNTVNLIPLFFKVKVFITPFTRRAKKSGKLHLLPQARNGYAFQVGTQYIEIYFNKIFKFPIVLLKDQVHPINSIIIETFNKK